jgi:hypothetical protein
MRSVKPHHTWKLDDERRKRSGPESVATSPTTNTHSNKNNNINNTNYNSGNYTHEESHTGIETIRTISRCTLHECETSRKTRLAVDH